jgi:hypothetical protein
VDDGYLDRWDVSSVVELEPWLFGRGSLVHGSSTMQQIIRGIDRAAARPRHQLDTRLSGFGRSGEWLMVSVVDCRSPLSKDCASARIKVVVGG